MHRLVTFPYFGCVLQVRSCSFKVRALTVRLTTIVLSVVDEWSGLFLGSLVLEQVLIPALLIEEALIIALLIEVIVEQLEIGLELATIRSFSKVRCISHADHRAFIIDHDSPAQCLLVLLSPISSYWSAHSFARFHERSLMIPVLGH